jgi:ATP-dependent exoDNAse (exonuclease V) alpha subunit
MRQAQALHIMMSGANVFLTGAPGAGKTYVLNQFVEQARLQHKTVAVTASTGIAATHIGGSTIHSWSGLGIREFLTPEDLHKLAGNAKLVKRYNATDVLVIDEVSMLHGQRLNMINQVCKHLRKSHQPFGGIQVVLVGDLFQLPPVSRGSNQVDFVHNSDAWRELNPTICYINEQHRQSEDGLLELLQAMRSGELQQLHQEIIAQRLNVQPDATLKLTRLYAHNVDIDSVNQRHLDAINQDVYAYTMETIGPATKVEQLQRSVLAPELLELKVGAEVMFVANHTAGKFVNGSRGSVIRFDADDMPVVKLQNNTTVTVEPHSWKLEEDGRVTAEVSQLPLRLAWAITIHKSQGMSLDAALVDLSKSFTPGMGYVALSRLRSLDGLYLAGINAMALRLHPDIHEFDQLLRHASSAAATNTPDYTASNHQHIDTDSDKELHEALRSWRTKRATADGVPAYIVAHDSVLEDLSRRKPITSQQLLGIKGFGPNKAEKYATDILAIILPYAD